MNRKGLLEADENEFLDIVLDVLVLKAEIE
jgi:hypothetical protein